MSNRGKPDHHEAEAGHGCDHDQDHDCNQCGAPPKPGLAACPYCRAAYPGLAAGVICGGCNAVNLKGRVECANCRASLTITCVFCNAVSTIDHPACTRCHELFDGAAERKKAREAARAAGAAMPRPDPTGAQIFGSLNDILKS